VARILQRLVLFFAGALLVPARAWAALLPACEAHDPTTRIPADWMPDHQAAVPPVAGGGEACAALPPKASDAADDVDVRIAAMCDARGASIVAPQRILPVGDARIEATPGGGTELGPPVIGPHRDHAPVASAAPALAQHAVLDAAVLVPPASSELAPPFPPVTGETRSGFAPGVDHPPR